MGAKPRAVFFYTTANGKVPFIEWLKSLRDRQAIAKITARLKRVEEEGNMGDWKPFGSNVCEFRLGGRRGYRIYYTEEGETILVLNGGVKDTQQHDIEQAKEFLVENEQREGYDQH